MTQFHMWLKHPSLFLAFYSKCSSICPRFSVLGWRRVCIFELANNTSKVSKDFVRVPYGLKSFSVDFLKWTLNFFNPPTHLFTMRRGDNKLWRALTNYLVKMSILKLKLILTFPKFIIHQDKFFFCILSISLTSQEQLFTKFNFCELVI